MSREPHNGRALALAELAARAAHVVALSCRTNDHRAPGWRGGVGRGGRWQHHHHRPGRMIGQRVSVSKIIRAQIDRETPRIGVAYPCKGFSVAVVRIRETTFASVCGHQLAELDSVNSATDRRQIARLVMAPQLAIGQRRDGGRELTP